MERVNNRVVWSVFMLLLAAGGGCAREEPGVEIPLSKIWAVKMPGTKDSRKLEPNHYGVAARQLPQSKQTELLISSLNFRISQVIRSHPKHIPIGLGFAVVGKGKEALGSVYEVLKNDIFLPQSISTNHAVTLFFYGIQNGQYLHLKSVYRKKKQVIIQFQFVPHMTMEMTQHFALIPLGKLPIGNYTVVLEQALTKEEINSPDSMMDRSFFQEKRKKWVCQDFEFTVVANRSAK